MTRFMLALILAGLMAAAGPSNAATGNGAGTSRRATISLTDCRITAGKGFPGIKARCGTLQRPLNPDAPEGVQIDLHVAVVPALSLKPQNDPLVPLAGGPGQGAIQFYAAYAAAFEPVRRHRDILLVDQRGTGDSASLDCAVDSALEEQAVSIEASVAETQSCLESLPYDPRYFTSAVAIEDLEAVRKALAYSTLNLYGVSYGTRVAQEFARRYPAATRSIVLDGVVPPQIPLGPDIALDAQSALDNIFSRCASDAACGQRFPGLAKKFADLKSRLDKTPVSVTFDDPVSAHPQTLMFDRDVLAASIRLLAYNADTIALLPFLINEAANGNFAPLAAQYQMSVTDIGEAISLGMHNSVMCSEDVPFYDAAAIDEQALSASYMGPLQVQTLQAICKVWPSGPVPAKLHEPLSSDLPVLLLAGDADPITPPRYAKLAMAKLTRARLLIDHGQGHGQLAVGCMPKLIGDFVAAADPQAVDADCMARSFVMPFFLDYSGPSP